MITVSQSYQKEANRSLLMELIRTRGPISRAELSRITSFSRAAITGLLTGLVGKGVLVERTGSASRSGGKRPVELMVNPEAAYSIGIDLHRDRAETVLVDLLGRRVDSYDLYCTGNSFTDYLNQVIEGSLEHYRKSFLPLRAVGIALSGVVDPYSMVVKASHLHRVYQLGINRELAHLPVPVFIENDANCAALCELFGPRTFINALLILPRIIEQSGLLRVETGGAVVVDRRLWHGSRFVTGEFSMSSWFSESVERVPFGKEELKQILSSDSILGEYLQSVLTKLISAARMLDPDLIILAGIASERFDLVKELLSQRLKESWYDQEDHRERVVPALQRERAVALGAGLLMHNRLFFTSSVGSDDYTFDISWEDMVR